MVLRLLVFLLLLRLLLTTAGAAAAGIAATATTTTTHDGYDDCHGYDHYDSNDGSNYYLGYYEGCDGDVYCHCY